MVNGNKIKYGKIEYYSLTHPQKGIWYTEKLYPDTSIGNIAATLRIKGDIDYRLFEKAVNIFLEKNDSIRLRIVEQNGGVKQYVSEYRYIKPDFLDFSEKGLESLYIWDEQQTRVPFSLVDSDLFYFALVKINEHDGGIYAKIHHLVADAWSVVRMGNKILEYYWDLKNGIEISKEKEPSYIEYIDSEEEYKNSQRFQNDRMFWNEKFRTIPELTTLSKRNTSYVSTKAKRKTFIIPTRLASKIREYCKDTKTSVFAVFLSILSIYINRITSKEDMVLGTPVLNRSNAREKNIMGMFISTSPIRINVDDTLSFASFVKTVSREWISLLRYQKYPYDLLLKDIRERYKGAENLYDISLSYQNAKFIKDQHIGQHEGRWHFNGHQTDSLCIHINDREDNGNLILDYDYLTQLFNVKNVEYTHKHLINLLQDAIENPFKKLNQLDILSEDEKDTILYEFNSTEAGYPKDRTIHSMFEEQVKKTPENIAAIFEDRHLTYRELNEKANQLARLLRKRGVRPDSIVGIMANRSLEVLVGMVAVLKAGGAFLPIDPEYPEERIRYMLEESNAGILLTQRVLTDRVKFGGRVVDLFAGSTYRGSCKNIEDTCSPKNLAYVIYTSGSTGKPKGVMIEHRSVMNFVSAVTGMLGFSAQSTVLSITTISFDIFVFETLPSLLNGAAVVIANESQQKIPALLKKLIIDRKVDKILATPSQMQLIITEKSNPACLKNIKEIMLGGESFPETLLKKLRLLTQARIFNGYGPTEITIGATFKDLTDAREINIGKPINNTRIYILDKNMIPVPIGVSGELCISGDGLARGYLNRAELTNEKFVLNPFVPGDRMYRTGDLARWYPKGDIEYLGRMDHQVKIRGFRIELDEIKNHLLDHKQVKDAIVVDKVDKNGRKYLCAYVVSNTGTSVPELKSFLAKKLPNYMVPYCFIRLEHIPLTPSGKIDLKMLPEPEGNTAIETEYAAPRNDIEKILADIWCKVLGVERAGINDNFFELGGDSLTVVQVQTAIFPYRWNLTTQEFYRHQTIRELSDKIRGIADAGNDSECYWMTEIGPFTGEKLYGGCMEENRIDNILLTGATGFLGIHILDGLLSDTDANVYCLVRDKDGETAEKRLLRLLNFYFPVKYKGKTDRRIIIVKGDITLERFGLSEQHYAELFRRINIVIHAAGMTKHYGIYDDFEKVNVKGTGEVIKFCLKNSGILYHISTISVSGQYLTLQDDRTTVFTENDFNIGQRYMENVYVRSKYEEEDLVYKAKPYGLNASVLRVGNLTGRYSDGRFQVNVDENAFYNRIKSVIKLGAIPERLLHQELEFTPVDCCSKIITGIIKNGCIDNRVFHLFNHNTVSMNFMFNVLNSMGIRLEVLDAESFRKHVESVSQDSTKLQSLKGIINDFNRELDLVYDTSVRVSSEITRTFLKENGMDWPEIDCRYINKIIDYMKYVNYL